VLILKLDWESNSKSGFGMVTLYIQLTLQAADDQLDIG
jgi:hypothetical protein